MILERKSEGERERERNISLLFHLVMHSLVASCMCPDQRSNLQAWHVGTTLYPTKLPVTACLSMFQQPFFFFFVFVHRFLIILYIKNHGKNDLFPSSIKVLTYSSYSPISVLALTTLLVINITKMITFLKLLKPVLFIPQRNILPSITSFKPYYRHSNQKQYRLNLSYLPPL